jgi:hypothetical protein
MSSTGEVNWVSEGRLIKIQSLNNIWFKWNTYLGII